MTCSGFFHISSTAITSVSFLMYFGVASILIFSEWRVRPRVPYRSNGETAGDGERDPIVTPGLQFESRLRGRI